MSFEERNCIAFLFVTPAMGLWAASRIGAGMSDGSFLGADGVMLWARAVLWIIAVGVGVCITAVIAGNILYAIVTGDEASDFGEDERDKLIAIRGNRVTMVVIALCWIIALIGLARGTTVLTGLNLTLAGFFLGDFAGNLSRLIAYRRGV